MRKLVLFGLLAGVVGNAAAVVWRHDIPESTVLNFGATDQRFQGVGMVNVGGGYGTGTFIGFGNGFAWGLSAKHVISSGQTGTFTFEDGRSFAINQAIGFAGTDISIFRMGTFTAGTWRPALNDSSANFTAGALIDSAGYGGHGAQGSLGGNWIYDNKRRGMQTRIDAMVNNFNFNGDTFLAIQDRFDSPASGLARAIEGFGAPGDSGSALFTPEGMILGVLSGGEFETYGNRNWYAALTPTISNQIYNLTGIAPVPEPATMLVLGLGALAVARRRRTSK